MVKSEEIKDLALALVKAQTAMGNASKGANNPFFKSKYADLNAVREAVLPPLNENNISVLQLISANAVGKPIVLTTLMHESGQYISSETEIVVAKQNDPQAYGSAISYARRYGLQAMVCVGAEDDDGEKAMSRSAAPMQTKVSAPVENKSSFKKPVAQAPAPKVESSGVDGWE